MITLQADFTDQPEHLPELIKRFEGGADLVVAERTAAADHAAARCAASAGSRRGRCAPSGRVPGVADPFGALRLYRISLIRDLLKESGDAPIVQRRRAGRRTSICCVAPRRSRAAWRRCALDPRYDVRARESRIRPWSDGLALFRVGRARARRERPAS